MWCSLKILPLLCIGLFVLSACAGKQVLPLPEKGPLITQLQQQDLYPIAQLDSEQLNSETRLAMPKLTKKSQRQQFNDEVLVTWSRSGSGTDLLFVNQSLQTTWQLLNEALKAGDYAVEDIKDATGVVEVELKEGIEMPANEKSILGFFGNGVDELFSIEFRVDALSDGTMISVQFSDDLLLPETDNLRELNRIKTLIEQ